MVRIESKERLATPMYDSYARRVRGEKIARLKRKTGRIIVCAAIGVAGLIGIDAYNKATQDRYVPIDDSTATTIHILETGENVWDVTTDYLGDQQPVDMQSVVSWVERDSGIEHIPENEVPDGTPIVLRVDRNQYPDMP